MTDIFHEVEEEVRREKLQKLWEQYGNYIIAVVLVAVVAFAGWQFWKYYDAKQRAEAAAAYQAAHVAAANKEYDTALQSFDKLAQDSPAGYEELSALSAVNTLAASGKTGEAITAYKAFAEKYNDSFGDAARIRAGWLMVEGTSLADMTAFLKSVSERADGYGPAAREILAYAQYRAGNLSDAQKSFEALASDPEATQGVAQRAQAMATYIKAGATESVGTVPPVAETASGTPTP